MLLVLSFLLLQWNIRRFPGVTNVSEDLRDSFFASTSFVSDIYSVSPKLLFLFFLSISVLTASTANFVLLYPLLSSITPFPFSKLKLFSIYASSAVLFSLFLLNCSMSHPHQRQLFHHVIGFCTMLPLQKCSKFSVGASLVFEFQDLDRARSGQQTAGIKQNSFSRNIFFSLNVYRNVRLFIST